MLLSFALYVKRHLGFGLLKSAILLLFLVVGRFTVTTKGTTCRSIIIIQFVVQVVVVVVWLLYTNNIRRCRRCW